MPINSNDIRTVEDLRNIMHELAGLLDQLDQLKAEEVYLSKKRDEAETLVQEIGAEFYALYQSEQRKADRLRDQIAEPQDELKKIKNYGTGYSSIMGDRIKGLEAQIAGNAVLEKKRGDMLAKPVKLRSEQTAGAKEFLSEIRERCKTHDTERARIHSEIVHKVNTLSEDAKALSRYQGTNFPDCSVDSRVKRLSEYTDGVYLRG